jgi:hypothetical protein
MMDGGHGGPPYLISCGDRKRIFWWGRRPCLPSMKKSMFTEEIFHIGDFPELSILSPGALIHHNLNLLHMNEAL